MLGGKGMKANQFRIVFEKLREAVVEEMERDASSEDLEAIARETEAIAELKRIVLETSEVPPKSYTTT